ncbi:MAG: murein L,D-transpeptidase catalytic domain family protein [Bacteroidetes bacterium]|nr:murein L,D-transpeptidase catalytic domain family protein [Bacteroidota bacterium]
MNLILLFLSALLRMALPGYSGGPAAPEAPDAADALYRECGLAGLLDEDAFVKALQSRAEHHEEAGILAVADMTRPSTEKRLFIIDLRSRKLLLQTWVAHGKNSGDLYCTSVSNKEGSLQTSQGLYRVGEQITSPKHGAALLLHGLDRGLNSAALQREVIIHAAPYVGAAFIAQHGRLGRSWGCPAVAPEVMPRLIDLLQGQLLYVFAK